MYNRERKCNTHDIARRGIRISKRPRKRGQELEEEQEVGERWIGGGVGVFGLFPVIDIPEHLLRRDHQMRHFPDGDLKVHLRYCCQALEDLGEAESRSCVGVV